MAFVERKASGSKPKGKGKPAPKVKTNVAKREKFNDEIRDLQKRIDTFFDQLPLSSRTLKGLKSSHFVAPTPIQSKGIPPSLLGRDVLGSAKTGSAKTLAFLIPLLERLYLLKWGPMDGLGAVVISPTRELAVQTFTALRDIGKYHNFSAGLVIGGKPLKEEKDRLARMNILVATPGRLLQHLDSTVGFESAGLKLLVLDEADRLLDLGFLPALRAIITHFGTQGRQTLLFSATQTSDLASLAKLSLRDPLYINCNKAGEEGVTPASLEQFYSVIPLPRKLDALWGFVKSHLKMKGVVFVTSGKQVRFIFETFRKLHPGLPVMHLHGKQKQVQRLTIFQKFSSSPTALLVTTDVSARGLDFPSVDWVVQLDCPEDVDTYIHRVGRTARYKAEGKGLIFLCPSEEEGMKKRWEEKGVVVKQIKIKEAKMGNLKQSLQNFSFREPEIKYLGQRAFISYMRSLHIQKDKTIFDFSQYPAEEFAASLGLPGAPQIKLNEGKGGRVRGGKVKEAEVEVKADLEVVASSDEEEIDEEEEDEDVEEAADEVEEEAESEEESGSGSDEDRPIKAQPVRTKFDRMFERTNQSILTPHYSALISHEDAEDEDDIFTLARPNHTLEEHTAPASDDLSKRKLKAAASKKGQMKNRPGPEKVIYDEEGNEMDFYRSGVDVEAGAAAERDEFLQSEKERMREADKVDRAVAREKKREKKRKRKEREREVREGLGSEDEEEGMVAVIGGADSGSEGEKEERVPERKEKRRKAEVDNLEDEEALALRLLGQCELFFWQVVLQGLADVQNSVLAF